MKIKLKRCIHGEVMVIRNGKLTFISRLRAMWIVWQTLRGDVTLEVDDGR